jgi:hypothetical protein
VTLTEFLRARLDEDEVNAREIAGPGGFATRIEGDAAAEVCTFADPVRVLAEVEAKRRIVTAWSAIPNLPDAHSQQARETASHVFRCLALPYADHPDYDEEWKP